MSIFEELRVLDDDDAPQTLKFASCELLLWPFVRSIAVGAAQKQALGLQTAFATGQRRSVRGSASLVLRSLLRSPLSVRRPFDVVIVGSSAGLQQRDGRWFDRINDYFAMEMRERTLVLDRADHDGYKTPRSPPHVRCFDSFEIRASLNVRLARGRPHDADLRAIERLLGFISDRFPVALSSATREQIRTHLVQWSLRLPILREQYARFFDRVQPHVIVMEDGSSGAFAHICSWARAAGIATADSQHGIVASSHLDYNYGAAACANEAFASCLPRYLMLYGEFWRSLVRSPSETVVVGCPHFSETAHRARASAGSVVVISQGIRTEALVRLTAAVARRFPERRCVFRLHPGEVSFRERYAPLAALDNVEISDRGDIYRELEDASVVIGHSSMALVEAAGLGLPVLVLDDEASRAMLPDGVGTWFRSADELMPLMDSPPRITSDPGRFFAGNWQERYRSFVQRARPTR